MQSTQTSQSTALPTSRRVAPVLTLLVLAPIVVEFLLGSTHISMAYLLLPQIGVYGCGALIIRAVVRSRHRGWIAILLLGLAFSIVEECLILQTALAPLFIAVDKQHVYGRALGVNWIYLLYQFGYESIWAIILPIQLTEVLFPEQRDDSWVGKTGLVVASVIFILASVVTWYLWGQAVQRFMPGPGYQVPPLTFALSLAAIVVLAIAALISPAPSAARPTAKRRAPRPWLVRLVVFWLAFFWFALAVISVGVAPTLPVAGPVVYGLALAAIAYTLMRRWSSGSTWSDSHRLALVSGALIASMFMGILLSGIREPVDWIGKLVLNILAVVGLLYLGWKIRRREQRSVNS